MMTNSSIKNQSSQDPSPRHHSNMGTISSVVGLSFVMLLSIVGNVLIIVIFRMFKRVRKQVTNHFLINLAISDLIVALVTMPFWLLWEVDRWDSLPASWNKTKMMQCWTFLDIACEAGSIVNLAVVSIDRLYSVSNPFKHHTTVTPSVAHKIVIAAWAYALAVASISLLDTYWKTLLITIFAFVIPLTLMIVCYTKIVFVVRAFRQRWKSNPEANKHFFGCMVNEYKTAKSLGIVMVVFVICWMPFFVSSMLYNYCHKCMPFFLSKHGIAIPTVMKWLHYLNSALNPILYTFFNPSYRVAFRCFYTWCFHKQNYRCTGYEAWYLGSRRFSTNSQRSTSLATALNSYASMHRPSCGSVTSSTRSAERPEVTVKEEDNDDGTTNEGAFSVDELDKRAKDGKDLQNKRSRPNRKSTTKNRVSFCDSDTIL